MRGTPLVLRDFEGGLNLVDDPAQIGFGQAVDLFNVEPNGAKGGLHRREALQVAYGAPGAAAVWPSFLQWVKPWTFFTNATNLFAIGLGGNKNLGAHFPEGPHTIVSAVKSGGQGPYFMLAGSGTPKQWDGAAAALANWTAATGAIPPAWSGIYAANRVIATNDASGVNPQRVWASAPGDPRNWGTAAGQGWQVDLEGELSATRAVCACGPYAVVFKEDRVYLIYDLDTGANRVIYNDGPLMQPATGPSLHPAYVQHGDEVFWLGANGIYKTNGNSVVKVSQALGDAAFTFTGAGDQLVALEGFIGYLQSGVGRLYLLDLQTGAWWRHGGFPGAFFDAVMVGVTSPSPTFHVMRHGIAEIDSWMPHHLPFTPTGASDGTTTPDTFTSYWTSGFSDLGEISRKKRIRNVSVAGNIAAGTLSMGLNRDTVIGTQRAVGLGSTVMSYAALTSGWGVGRSFQIAIADATTSRWRMDELEIDWQPRKG